MKTYKVREDVGMSHRIRPDDKDIIFGLRNGNPLSADELVHKYQNQLRAFLEHGMQVPWDIGQELLQDVFYKVVSNPVVIRPGTDRLDRFLYAACKNAATDWYRNRKRQEEHFAEVVEELLSEEEISDPFIESPTTFPEPHIVLLTQSLSGLDRRDRLILTMRADHFSYGEIAEVLKANEGNLRQRYRRALEEVRERYMNQLDNQPADVQARIKKKLKLD